jgi:hypothetical protein
VSQGWSTKEGVWYAVITPHYTTHFGSIIGLVLATSLHSRQFLILLLKSLYIPALDWQIPCMHPMNSHSSTLFGMHACMGNMGSMLTGVGIACISCIILDQNYHVYKEEKDGGPMVGHHRVWDDVTPSPAGVPRARRSKNATSRPPVVI